MESPVDIMLDELREQSHFMPGKLLVEEVCILRSCSLLILLVVLGGLWPYWTFGG